MKSKFSISAAVLLFAWSVSPALGQTIWRINNLTNIADHAVRALGRPQVIHTPHGHAVQFNGINDGLIVSNNLLAGLTHFTVELLFQPAYFEGAVLALRFTGRVLGTNEFVRDPARYDFSRSAVTHQCPIVSDRRFAILTTMFTVPTINLTDIRHILFP